MREEHLIMEETRNPIEGCLHKLWSLKSELTIPSEHIITAYPNTENLYVPLGWRMPGTSIPGLIEAGTFIGRDGVIFCDISIHSKSIVVELRNEHYNKLIIDVEDPDSAIALLAQK